MYQEYDATSKVQINRDDKDVARELLHQDEFVVTDANTPQLAHAAGSPGTSCVASESLLSAWTSSPTCNAARPM